MLSLRIQLALAGILAFLSCAATAAVEFTFADIREAGSETLLCDLDGDGLKEVVLVDGIDVSVFYQDQRNGFSGKPPLKFRLPNKPSLLWSALMGTRPASLLSMTSDGITIFSCTNRGAPPVGETIINHSTFVPSTLDEARVMCVPMSANTGQSTPVILVPTDNGVGVWERRDTWKRAQTIKHGPQKQVRVSVTNPGYTAVTQFNMSLGDINGDGRDDLILMQSPDTQTQLFAAYLATTNGLFTEEPSLTYTAPSDGHSWHCWVDINRDGKTDLIRNQWLDEPTFIPGTRSGKVLVGLHFADKSGKITDEPQHIFRKHDWTPSVPVVDIDGDGFLDLVLGYSLFDTREGVRKMLSAKQIDLNLKFHFYRSPDGYPTEPEVRRDLIIHLSQQAIALSWSRRHYFQQFVSFDGDFNGDGRKDLLVRERADRIAVYFFQSKSKGFSDVANLSLRCPDSADEMQVTDLNGDKISDLVVESESGNLWRVFISSPK